MQVSCQGYFHFTAASQRGLCVLLSGSEKTEWCWQDYFSLGKKKPHIK